MTAPDSPQAQPQTLPQWLLHTVHGASGPLFFIALRLDLRDLLRAEGFMVRRKHMTTLMRRMGITALYRKPNTSRRAPGQTIYP